jgi:myo-inositol 2-dehydrogenase/D-chiro-inositol 1-dehydrogenase
MNLKPVRLPRRRFLRQLLAAGVAPLAVPRHVLGLGTTTPPSRRINLGFIGTGRQVFFANLPAFLAAPEVQVVALCDVDRWRLEQARDKVHAAYAAAAPSGTWKGCDLHRDFRALLARSDIDAVMISTPDHWHAVMAVAALRAGKDVALEKPISLTLREGRAIADAAAKHQRVFRTDTEVRSTPFFTRLCEVVRNGAIGRVQRVVATTPKSPPPIAGFPAPMPVPADLDYDLWLGPAPDRPYTQQRVHHPHGGLAYKADEMPGWFQIDDYNIGNLNNWGGHVLDIVQLALGTERTGPVHVEARAEFPTDSLWNVPRNYDVRFRYGNGIEVELRDTGQPSVRVEGTSGWIENVWFKSSGFRASDPALLRWKPGPGQLAIPAVSEKEDFIACVLNRRETLIPAEVGHRTASLGHLAYIAARLGTALRWDPQTETFPDHPAANDLLDRPRREPWTL